VNALYLVCQPILFLQPNLVIVKFTKALLRVVFAILPNTLKPELATQWFLNAQLTAL
jgi:hypothetical protein